MWTLSSLIISSRTSHFIYIKDGKPYCLWLNNVWGKIKNNNNLEIILTLTCDLERSRGRKGGRRCWGERKGLNLSDDYIFFDFEKDGTKTSSLCRLLCMGCPQHHSKSTANMTYVFVCSNVFPAPTLLHSSGFSGTHVPNPNVLAYHPVLICPPRSR